MFRPRPSGAGRWVLCPAAPRLEAIYPSPQGPEAEEGDAAHWLAAQVLGGHVAEIEELTDRKAPNGFVVSGDMVDHTTLYIDEVRKYSRTPVIEKEIESVPGVEPGHVDSRVKITYPDLQIWGFLWDFKYGYGIVEARGNWQLANYIVGMFRQHEWTLTGVRAAIVQPRPWHPDGKVREWIVTQADARILETQLIEAANRVADPNAPTITGPHCKDCLALHSCEAARRASMNAIDVAMSAHISELNGVDLAEELKVLKRAKDAIEKRLDAQESHALRLIDSGHVVPGYMGDWSYGHNAWKGDSYKALSLLTGVDLTEPKPVTPAEAKRRGIDESLVKMFSERPRQKRKLVARDVSEAAKKAFGNG